MLRVACPGSFDPPTNGHLDIFRRVSALADEVVVVVLVNPAKRGLFTPAERVEMLEQVAGPLGNVAVESFSGLLVDFCRERSIPTVVKGLRGPGDFDFELQMAQMNHRLAGVDTLFIPTAPDLAFVSSSLVKEVATYGGDVTDFVPPAVHGRMLDRIAERRVEA